MLDQTVADPSQSARMFDTSSGVLSHVLSFCSKHMDARTLAKCCAVDKFAREVCKKEVLARMEGLILELCMGTVALGTSTSREVLWRVHGLKWLLLKRAAEDAIRMQVPLDEAQQVFLQSISSAMISTPAIHRRLAGALYVAGMPISFDQLVAAARQRVPGVEVWLQLNIRNGNKSNLPLEGMRPFR